MDEQDANTDIDMQTSAWPIGYKEYKTNIMQQQ